MSVSEAQTASVSTGADFFSVFELARKLQLDLKFLERTFYRKSREVHPDRFAQAPSEKQQWSLQQTSLLNDAYRTLKDPVTRTEYLLRLEGMTLADEKSQNKVPAELLAEVFELNMQLEEMRMGEDDPHLRADLEAARAQFDERFAVTTTEIEHEWAVWDSGDRASLNRMAALLNKHRYLRNLVRDVREALGS